MRKPNKRIKTDQGRRQERMVSQPTRIEQPSSINGRKWFFARGYAGGFGAEYGPTLDKRTVYARCEKKAGAGKLVCIKGVWHWLANGNSSEPAS